MERGEVKVGQIVRVTSYRGGLFSSDFEGKQGRVTRFDFDHIWVDFGGDEDYGRYSDCELVTDVDGKAATVKEAIANVETALAALKALVG